MWAWSRNSECGRATTALAMLASPGRTVRIALRAGLSARLVPPESLSESLGPKGSAPQPPTWKGLVNDAGPARVDVALPTIAIGSQEVGLRVKAGRSVRRAIERR